MALVGVLLTGAVAALFLSGTTERTWPGVGLTYMLAAGLGLVLAWQVHVALRDGGPVGLLSPLVLACFIHFFLGYFLPLLLGDEVILKAAAWSRRGDPIPLINRTLGLAILCAISMFVAYQSRFARNAATRLKERLQSTGWFRSRFEPRTSMVVAMLALSLTAIGFQINLGVFGYSSDQNALSEFAEYRRVLDMSASLLTLLLFLVAMGAFSARRESRPHFFLYCLLASIFVIHVGIGVLTGFKSQVVMPAVVVGVAYFIRFQRLPVLWLVAGSALLVLAYTVVEPFRELRNTTSSFQSTSLSSITETAFSAAEAGRSRSNNTSQRLFQRSELISPTVAALQHADALRASGARAPDLLEAIILSPVLAVVPRAIWPSKPTYQTGRWFAIAALRQPPTMNNAVGMGAMSYFNYVGGTAACILGFLTIGFLMRVLWSGLTPLGAGGWITYLAVLQPLATIPGEIGPALTGLLQLLPLAVLAQWVVLRR